MSQADVAARARAATAPAQPSVVTAGAWLRTPSAAPGVFRVRPLPGEATASYTQRLADTYQLTLPQLLDGAGITLHSHATPPSAELVLTPGAARRLAVLARTPLLHLMCTLPDLPLSGAAHDTDAAAYRKRLDAGQQPVRACTLCTRHRSHDATDTAWIHPPPHQLVCPRHHQAAPDPRLTTTIRTWAAPELVTAHYAHQRLRRHPRAATAWTTAAPSPPAGTTTNNTSPTTGTPVWAGSARPTPTSPPQAAPPPPCRPATW